MQTTDDRPLSGRGFRPTLKTGLILRARQSVAYFSLAHRALLTISGADRKTFLQGLISNDVLRLDGQSGVYAGFLTAQGKFQYDLFVAETEDQLIVEVEAAGRAALLRKLAMYVLRAAAKVAALDGWQVIAVLPEQAAEWGLAAEAAAGTLVALPSGGWALRDPRLAAAGWRLWLPDAVVPTTPPEDFSQWDTRRIALGLPDGSRDLIVEKSLLLENGFDELHGVDWKKGCYLGQEMTARTKYRALIRKRLLPVQFDGPPPVPGTLVLAGGEEAGEIRSVCGSVGLALLRLEVLDQPLQADAATLQVSIPAWVTLPQAKG